MSTTVSTRHFRATVATLLVAAGASLAVAVTSPPAGQPVLLARQGLDDGFSPTAREPAAPGAKPLLAASGLVPGHPLAGCVELPRWTEPGQVHLLAEELNGVLAPLLLVTVATGTGSSADCADFSGVTLYEGTLADLAASDGLDTGWAPADGARTFRVTVEVADDERAAGATATTTFLWVAVPASPDDDLPPPDSQAAWGTSASRADTGPSHPTTSPANSAPSGGDTSAVQSSVKHSPEPTVGIALEAGPVRVFLRDLARTAWLPLLLLVLLLVYLRLQDRLDRDDPKLALAPMHPDQLVPFPTSPRSRP